MKLKRILVLGLLLLGVAGCGNFTDPLSGRPSKEVLSGSNENGSGSDENGSGSSENGSGSNENG